MVKLTKTQLETKASKLVEFNDYEKFELFLYENPEFDINTINRKNYSLLHIAITNKSKECFDYILAHPKLIILSKIPKLEKFEISYYNYNFICDSEYVGEWAQEQDDDNDNDQNDADNDDDNSDDSDDNSDEDEDDDNSDEEDSDDNSDEDNDCSDNKDNYDDFEYSHYTGFNIALHKYINAPNFPNSYYVRELIKKNIYVSPGNLIKITNIPDMFNQIFPNVQNNILYMVHFLSLLIENNSEQTTYVYNLIKNQLTPDDLTKFVKKSIGHCNVTMLKLLISDGYDLRFISLSNNKYVDCLSYSLYAISNCYRSSNNSYNLLLIKFIFNYIKENSIFDDNLQNKFNAKMFVQVLLSNRNCITELVKEFDDLNQLNIVEDISPIIMDQFTKFILNGRTYIINLEMLNLLLTLKYCKTNIFDYINVKTIDVYVKTQHYVKEILSRLLSLLYIGKYHNMEPSEEVSKSLFIILKIQELGDVQAYYKKNIKHLPLPKKKPSTATAKITTKTRPAKTSKTSKTSKTGKSTNAIDDTNDIDV